MRKMPGASLAASAALLLTFAGCGQNNLFSFAHKAGGDSSTAALTSDANTALQNKDYTKALDYYTKILAADPSNSAAIYGFSAATLANSGLDIATLVSNLIKQQAGAPDHLAPAISFAAHSSSDQTNILPQQIIDNLPQIRAAIDRIMADGKLPSIVKGKADGTIDPDNPDVNINLAFCLILRAALKVQASGAVTFDKNYNVVISGNDAVTYKSVAIDAGKDVISAYQRLLVVYKKLNLGNDATLAKIKDDVQSLYNDLKTKFNITTELDINQDYL
jgi:tetratricopeptide (TPR) repeat protein